MYRLLKYFLYKGRLFCSRIWRFQWLVHSVFEFPLWESCGSGSSKSTTTLSLKESSRDKTVTQNKQGNKR